MITEEKKREDRYAGCMVGLAVGDALGYPTEFMKLDQIYRKYGPEGIKDFDKVGRHKPGTYTDDTQMTLAVARALLSAGKEDDLGLFKRMAEEFVKWSQSPDNDRAPGNTCMAACRRLAEGVPPLVAGIPESKGCGSVMRVAPVGLYYHGDTEKLLEVAVNQSRLTHRHPAALAASAAGALAVSLALARVDPTEWIRYIGAYVAGKSDEMDRKLMQLEEVLLLSPEEALPMLGEGWVAEEALTCALYCFMKSPADYRRTVLTGANTNGDSDSIASIAGGLSGAYNGVGAIPEAWKAGVEDAEVLQSTGVALYEASVRREEDARRGVL
jgi:ADP-ribosylglycohydrolase